MRLFKLTPLVVLITQLVGVETFAADNALSFSRSISIAQNNDPWLVGNKHQQDSIRYLSEASNTLPDPKMSIGFANLPTDGFDFDQEGMTQFKVGLTQMFPRGDSLAIKNRQLREQSEAYPYQRQDRKAKVAVTVGSLWLDTYRIEESIRLIEENRALFEQLADIAEASYSSAIGKTRQQDIVRAQLELTRLEDRLTQLAEQKNRYKGQLWRWLSEAFVNNEHYDNLNFYNLVLTKELPSIDLIESEMVASEHWLKDEVIAQNLSAHPSVIAVEKKIQATKTGIELANQKYKPEWAVNASYGYRDDDPLGNSRSDFMSVGVTFDLPLFTEDKQDNEVNSAISKAESIKTEKILLLRQLVGAFSGAKSRLKRIEQRQALYKNKLLPQIHDQADASLTAYTNDDGDFAEVVRSRISVLNAEIDAMTIEVEKQKLHLDLNYLFAHKQIAATPKGN